MVQAWRDTPLTNPLEADRLRWFTTACPDVDFKDIPLELAETLYPEVAAYGPNGFIVMEIFNDLMAMPIPLDSMNRDKANTALDEFEAFIKTLPLFEEGSLFGYKQNLDREINLLAEKTSLTSLTVESVAYVILFWVALDGFCKGDDTYDEGLEEVRQDYHAFLRRFFDLAGLESDDYLSLLSPRLGMAS